jgi:hypothetical protein
MLRWLVGAGGGLLVALAWFLGPDPEPASALPTRTLATQVRPQAEPSPAPRPAGDVPAISSQEAIHVAGSVPPAPPTARSSEPFPRGVNILSPIEGGRYGSTVPVLVAGCDGIQPEESSYVLVSRPDRQLQWPQGPLNRIGGLECLFELDAVVGLPGDHLAEVHLRFVAVDHETSDQWRRDAKGNSGVIPPFRGSALPDGVQALSPSISIRASAPIRLTAVASK